MIKTTVHSDVRKSLQGLSRHLFLLRMSLVVFLFFLKKTVSGSMQFKKFIKIIFRLQHFKAKQKQNQKFILIDEGIRTSLYIPTFPSQAFFRSCENFFNNNGLIRPSVGVVSISHACNCSCTYCYQKYDKKEELSLDKLEETVQLMLDRGVSLFVIEGGDPFLAYDRLLSVCTLIGTRAECWINTTGDGVDRERISELKKTGITALKISLHGQTDEEHNAFLGIKNGWQKMLTAVELCKEFDISFTFNTRITPNGFTNGFFESMMTLGAELGASYMQFLTPRTAGGNYDGKPITYSTGELQRLKKLFKKFNTDSRFTDYPAIFFDELDERCIFGCTAGSTRLYINVNGDVQPCQHLNISYGNLNSETYDSIINKMQKDFCKHGFTTRCTVLPDFLAKQIDGSPVFPVNVANVNIQEFRNLLNR